MALALSKHTKPQIDSAHHYLFVLAEQYAKSDDLLLQWVAQELKTAVTMRQSQIRRRAKKLGL